MLLKLYTFFKNQYFCLFLFSTNNITSCFHSTLFHPSTFHPNQTKYFCNHFLIVFFNRHINFLYIINYYWMFESTNLFSFPHQKLWFIIIYIKYRYKKYIFNFFFFFLPFSPLPPHSSFFIANCQIEVLIT